MGANLSHFAIKIYHHDLVWCYHQLWEYNERVIYMENKIFRDCEHYQVLHEFTFLQTDENETIFIFALFGTEYAISLDRKIKRGYLDWLVKNNEKSPLYP